MSILLRWLIDHVWVLYVGCAIGALIYLVRALAAQREQSLAMFTLEHETATARAVRGWIMVFVFIAVSLLIFMGTRFVQASFPGYDATAPAVTGTPSSGVTPPTPGVETTLEAPMAVPTLTLQTATPPTGAQSAEPTALPTTAPTEVPETTPTATIVPAGPLSGSMQVQFGEFGELVGWELSASQVSVGELLVLTLYWRGLAGESPTDYTVFTHLLSQGGELLAQHDGPPAGGTKGTTDWAAGETIVDSHQLTFTSGAAENAGPASVVVGLYDPENIDARVMTSQGQDYATLPVTVDVTAE